MVLSKLQAKQHIEIDLSMDELNLTSTEKKATYQKIRDYVLAHSGLKVSSLYIAQVKQRCGIIERENYCYRFISEFSGKSIDYDDAKAFKHQFYEKGSVSSRSLEGISKRVQETKTQIDNILKLLNDAAEYRSSESNIKLQWIMMIVTILSLFVALSSINNSDVVNDIKNLIEWLKTIMSQ